LQRADNFIADAHSDDGQRFIADEKLSAFSNSNLRFELGGELA